VLAAGAETARTVASQCGLYRTAAFPAKRTREQKKPDDYGVDTMKITDDDAAFILGKGGKTKEKISRVSEAEIELFERDLILEIRGSKLQRRRAKKIF